MSSAERGSGPICPLVGGPQRGGDDGFTFRRVRAVRIRDGNHPVTFPRPPDMPVRAGQMLETTFQATDPDGDPVVFFLQQVGTTDIPLGSDFIDHRDGTATFEWLTRAENTGVHLVRVGAFDEGGGKAIYDVVVAVCSRIEHDATLGGVLAALFDAEPPASCRDADRNGDHRLTAADLVVVAGAL